jgi:hypothetical protein
MQKYEDQREMTSWESGRGNHVSSHNENDVAFVQTSATSVNPSGAESKIAEDKREMKSWASGKGNHVAAHSSVDTAYVQTDNSK